MMIDRIRSKFAGWKAQTLSRAGRLTLIKASVSGIPNHTLSCFKCPREVCKEMNVCSRRFFWGNGTKVPPVSWKDICLPKSLGGLGVRSTILFNKAALAKLGWIYLSEPTNWWAQIMAKKYIRKDGFLAATKKTSHSAAWKAILDARTVLHKGLRWIVGNGQSIFFWTENWVFPFPILDLIPDSMRNNLNLNAKVANFIQNQTWQRDRLLQEVDEDILEEILIIPLHLSPLQDALIWGPDPNGKFSIKSAYNLQVHDETPHPRASLPKRMWSLTLPPKVKPFAWLLIRKRLQVRSHLYKYLPNINPECPLCNDHMETINHLFFKCQVAVNIWRCTPIIPMFPQQDFDGIEWLAALPSSLDKDGPNILSKALLLCWQIWEARNNLVFKDIAPHPARALHVAGQIGLDYWKINSTPPQKSKGMLAIKWKPPPCNWVKLNFDGSVRGALAATGFVIRDWNGHVRLAGAKNLGQISITVAECLALRDGLAHAIHNGWRKVVAEGDSKLVIDCINNKVSVPWSINLLVQDIRLLSSYCDEISFQHVLREANITADALASIGHNLNTSHLWDRGLPLSCLTPFYFDLVGPACPHSFRL
ncbi:PREDICTED: ribonuclease [Prunus dulcis]|uniref:PREDICTED: ribonuclease n=1 Tax=Prunus dulcis TaxID=3755 RepID=A0A5E4FNB9_PRUDU|nr:PREDICTED: ribonuclease [Prunus dulcis]